MTSQELLYAAGERKLPYYYHRYPDTAGNELDAAAYPGVTYWKY